MSRKLKRHATSLTFQRIRSEQDRAYYKQETDRYGLWTFCSRPARIGSFYQERGNRIEEWGQPAALLATCPRGVTCKRCLASSMFSSMMWQLNQWKLRRQFGGKKT